MRLEIDARNAEDGELNLMMIAESAHDRRARARLRDRLNLGSTRAATSRPAEGGASSRCLGLRPALPAPRGQAADGEQQDGSREYTAARECRRRRGHLLRALPGVTRIVTGLPRRAGGFGATGVVDAIAGHAVDRSLASGAVRSGCGGRCHGRGVGDRPRRRDRRRRRRGASRGGR
jgi:hypothetical protein